MSGSPATSTVSSMNAASAATKSYVRKTAVLGVTGMKRKLADLLEVERELARVQGEIDAIQRAADTGIYDIRGWGAKRPLPHFDDLLFLHKDLGVAEATHGQVLAQEVEGRQRQRCRHHGKRADRSSGTSGRE